MSEKKEGPPVPHSIKALLVDDQVDDLFKPHRNTIERRMEGEVEFVSSVQEAFEILKRQAENGSLPDIVVTDLYVPEVNDCFEFIKRIRSDQDPRVSSLPICVIAVCLEKSEKLQLKELGVEKILDKSSIAYDSQKIRWALEESQEIN